MQLCRNFPPFRIDHLVRMTDSTGIIQHANYGLPNLASGYTTDDNARALVLVLRLLMSWDIAAHLVHLGDSLTDRSPESIRRLLLDHLERYMSFLAYAQREDGMFHNFVDYTRAFADKEGSEDSFGRAIFACAFAMTQNIHPEVKRLASAIFDRAWKWHVKMCSPRARAHLILAFARLCSCSDIENGGAAGESGAIKDKYTKCLTDLADSLTTQYRSVAKHGWRWFEDYLTYSNALMPESLFVAYMIVNKDDYIAIAMESLDFLTKINMHGDKIKLIGNRGWFVRGNAPGQFDEQPVDAAHLVDAYAAAYRATGQINYGELALKAFEWFHGRNVLGMSLYDTETGGCYDGLTETGPNLNQGAESLLCYLASYLTVMDLARVMEASQQIA